MVCVFCFITARKRSLRRLCFHRYLSVHGGGGCLPHCMLGYTTTTPTQTPLLPSACWDTINKWAVRMLLEYILVQRRVHHRSIGLSGHVAVTVRVSQWTAYN